MYEHHSRRKRRIFDWPEEVMQLVRNYFGLGKKGHGHGRNALATLATRVTELSGNPRDACFRFLHQQGITEKRAWRPWTKPEQQRLFDLIETCPVEEISRSCNALQIPFAPCCIVWAKAHKEVATGSRFIVWRKPYTYAVMKCEGGSIAVGSNAASWKQPVSRNESSTLMISPNS